MPERKILDRRRWAADTAEEIRQGRTDAHDPDLARMEEHQLGVVAHVHTYRRPSPQVRQAEWFKAWRLLDHWERLEIPLARLALLDAARAAGMSYAAIGRELGVTRQAVEATRVRLESAVAGGPKTERPTRATRKHRRETQHRRLTASEVLFALARTLIAAEDQMPSDLAQACGADVEELRLELAELTPGGPPSDKLAADTALICRELAGRPVESQLRRVIEHAAQQLGLRLPAQAATPTS